MPSGMGEVFGGGVVKHSTNLPIYMEESESGFLAITTTLTTAAGPFTLPQPDAPLIFAFMISEWTSFMSTGGDVHSIQNQISFDGGSTWSLPANAGVQAVTSEAGETHQLGTIVYASTGAPTGTIQFRTRGVAVGANADDLRWPKHIFGYIPVVA